MHNLYEKLLALDALLVTKGGFPPLSPFWRDTFREFLTGNDGKYRQLVGRIGRQGGKSTSVCRLGVIVALYGEFTITPGSVATIAFVSANRDQSAERLRTIAKILDVMKVPYSKVKEKICLRDKPIEFHIYSATIASCSGMSTAFFCCDELAKWSSDDAGSNPASEILASLRPSTVTHKNALAVLISSPMSNHDEHYKCMKEGTTETQLCVEAPSWIANPMISEARTHELEKDLRIWAREYAAKPQAAVLGCFDPAAIERAFQPREPYQIAGQNVMIIDAASGKLDAFTYGICHWELGPDPYLHEGGNPDAPVRRHIATKEKLLNPNVVRVPPILKFSEIGSLGSGSFWDTLPADELYDQVVKIARKANCRNVFGDQREAYSIKSAIEKRGLAFQEFTYSLQSKIKAVETVRRWLAETTLSIPHHDQMKAELYGFEEKVSPSGSFTYGARGSSHDDFTSLLLTAALADVAGEIPQSPFRKNVFRGALTRRVAGLF